MKLSAVKILTAESERYMRFLILLSLVLYVFRKSQSKNFFTKERESP